METSHTFSTDIVIFRNISTQINSSDQLIWNILTVGLIDKIREMRVNDEKL